MDSKRAELDSLARAGWPLDSLATLWGGMERVSGVQPAKGIVGLGGKAVVDSLLFGGSRPAALEEGEVSGWVQLDRGLARVRLVSRQRPSADQVTARIDSRRRLAMEHGFETYFARLALTYPVRILDSELAQVNLPPLPDSVP